MAKKLFKSWGVLSGVRQTKTKGCWQAKLETQELTKEQKDIFTDFNEEQLGAFVFSPTEVKPEDIKDIPELTGEFKKDKSPSQRLRNVLFVFFKQTHKSTDDFELFYKNQMEKFISFIKDKLDD